MSADVQLRRVRALLALYDHGSLGARDALAQIERVAYSEPRSRIDGSIPATGVGPDGTAHVTLTDLVLVLDALQLAASVTESGERATTWRSLGYRLGDDRG